MTDTTFVAYSNATPITAAWLNDVNLTEYHLLGNTGTPPATVSDILANIGADTKYAALAGTNSFTGANTFNNNTIYSIRNTQTAYSTAAFQAQSTSGDVHIGLLANGATATSIKHTRGGSGISVVDSGGTNLAPVSAAAATSTTQLAQFGQVIGLGQNWAAIGVGVNITSTNTSGRPLVIVMAFSVSNNSTLTATVNGITITGSSWSSGSGTVSVTVIVPIGGTYSASLGNATGDLSRVLL
jgi:hypothetical protein